MGKIITVWSSVRKTGKTVLLYSVIHQLAKSLNEGLKVLICCANGEEGNLMDLFSVDEKEINIEDLVNFKITSGGDIGIFEGLAKRNRLYFLGSKKTSQTYAARNIKAYEDLLRDFKGYFDIILVDAPAGKENILANMILQKSDYVINVLCQDKECLDRHPFTTNKDVAYIVNFFMEIYPCIKELASIYKLKSQIFALSQCTELQEMKNKGKLVQYMQHDTKFNNDIRNISDFILGKLGERINIGAVEVVRKKRLLKNLVANVIGEAYE